MKKQKAIALLRRAVKCARLESASFNNVCAHDAEPAKFQNGTPVTEGNVTDFIRERVRRHHDTWIVAPILEVIDLIEKG